VAGLLVIAAGLARFLGLWPWQRTRQEYWAACLPRRWKMRLENRIWPCGTMVWGLWRP